jgi:hypothetical protein
VSWDTPSMSTSYRGYTLTPAQDQVQIWSGWELIDTVASLEVAREVINTWREAP